MKSEVSDSYERLFFNFLTSVFVGLLIRYTLLVNYRQVGSAMSHWVTGLPAFQVYECTCYCVVVCILVRLNILRLMWEWPMWSVSYAMHHARGGGGGGGEHYFEPRFVPGFLLFLDGCVCPYEVSLLEAAARQSRVFISPYQDNKILGRSFCRSCVLFVFHLYAAGQGFDVKISAV